MNNIIDIIFTTLAVITFILNAILIIEDIIEDIGIKNIGGRMKLEDIIEEALIDRWTDKRTNKTFTQMPHYEIRNNVIQVYTPVKAYKLVVLRRLLKVANRHFKNIIVGRPDL